MIDYTDEQLSDARAKMIHAIAVLTFSAVTEPSLAARNVVYHAEELMKALDAFYAGRDPGDELECE